MRAWRGARITAACLCSGLFLLPVLDAQKPPSTQPSVVLRSTTRLVQLTVVVYDRKGKPVTDLQKGDFIVEDEGKRQEIRVFSLQTLATPAKPVAPPPPGVFYNRRAEGTNSTGGITVILLDGLNTRWGDQASARKKVIEYLLQIPPHDRVALYTLGKELRLLHDYTEDTAELLKALSGYWGKNTPDLAGSDVSGAISEVTLNAGSQDAVQGIVGTLQQESSFFKQSRPLTSISVFETIASHLAGVPGRKNLVWISAGFPLVFGYGGDDPFESSGGDPRYSARFGGAVRSDMMSPLRLGGGGFTFEKEFDHAVRALNAANVAVYPIDARGLTTNPHAMNNISTMKDLAKGTGGKAYYNRNDLQNSLKEALQDSQVSYTLAYYPSEHKLDGRFRRIKVKVNRPGVSVRHRRGYYDTGDAWSEQSAKGDALVRAVWSPVDATAVGLEAWVDLIDIAAPDTFRLHVKLDTDGITLDQREGRWIGEVDVALVQTDEIGRDYNGMSRTVPLEFQ